MGLRVVVAFDADEVTAPQQIVEARHPFETLRNFLLGRQAGALGVEDMHVKGAETRHHKAGDLAEADQADRLARTADAHQRQGLFLLEVSGAGEAVGIDHAVGEADQHPHRQIGRREADAAAHRDAGALAFELSRVGGNDRDLARGGRCHVDVEAAGGDRADALEPRRAVDDLRGDDVVADQHQPVGASRIGCQLVAGDLAIEVGVDRHFCRLAQDVERRLDRRLCNKDPGLHERIPR